MSSSTSEPGAPTPEEHQLHKLYPGCLSLTRATSAESPRGVPSDFTTFSDSISSRPTSSDSSLTGMQGTDSFALYRHVASAQAASETKPLFHAKKQPRDLGRSSCRNHNYMLLRKAVEIELESTKQTLSQLRMIHDDTMATLSRSLRSAAASHEKRRARAVRLGMTVEESSRVQELRAKIDMYTRGWEVTLQGGEDRIEELETKLWEMTLVGEV